MRISKKFLAVFLPVLFIGFAALMLCSIPAARAAGTFVVDTTDDSHDKIPADGVCRDTWGKCSLRAAIEGANTLVGAYTIVVPAGDYALTLGQLEISSELTVQGAGMTNTTISAQNNSRVMVVDSSASRSPIEVTLDGVTLQDGSVADDGGGLWNDERLYIRNSTIRNSSAGGNGGGLWNGGSLVMEGSTIEGNTAGRKGGGILNSTGSLTLTASVVTGNSVIDALSTWDGGGGIYNDEGGLTLVQSNVTSNTVTATDGSFGGGGINSYMGDVKVDDSNVQYNRIEVVGDMSSARGGGIFASSGQLELSNSRVYSNTAKASGFASPGLGGGMDVAGTMVSIDRTEILSNTSQSGGGAIENSSSIITISESTIAGNRGGGIESAGTYADIQISSSTIRDNEGGAMQIWYGRVTISESTISNNHRNYEGAIFVGYNGTLTVTNSTLSGNSSDEGGNLLSRGSVYLAHSTVASDNTGSNQDLLIDSGTLDMINTVVATRLVCPGYFYSPGYNLVEDSTRCNFVPTTGDIVGQLAQLADLADNGGGTWTRALLPSSPAIDAGTCSDTVGNTYPHDQRGAPRKGVCDIGAYEHGGTFTLLAASANPVAPGLPLTLTATVVEWDPATPTGNVAFDDQDGPLGSGVLDGLGQARLTLDDLTVGVYTITATYEGDSVFSASTSPALVLTVAYDVYLPLVLR